MFTHRAQPKAERRSIQQPADEWERQYADPHERIPRECREPRARFRKPGHPWRVRGAVEDETQEESREPDREQIDRDSDDHLIRPVSNGAQAVQERSHDASTDPGSDT